MVLIRQFRIATWVNGNADGRLIETCAGLLDDDEPEACVSAKKPLKRRVLRWGRCRKSLSCLCPPGEVTELIHFFIAEYTDTQRTHRGGGVDDEDIEVLEMPFAQAVDMVKRGEIRDGKAVILLQYLQTSGLMNAAAVAR